MGVRTLAAPDRRLAVEAILASRTFRRADQLRKLLAYLTEAQDSGRSHELTEYRIGVDALGRPPEFAPETDSSVRTRTHALRQKLEDYYRDEAPNAEIRVEIPKGSYIPVYREPSPNEPAPPPRSWSKAALAVGVAIAAAMALSIPFLSTRETKFEALWRPFLTRGQSVAIVIGQPVHLWIRDLRTHPPAKDFRPFPDMPPESDSFRRYYQGRRSMYPDSKLVLHPSPNAILWGDASGAASISRFLAFRQIPSELLPESTLRSELAIKDRNLIVLGRPEFSPIAGRYLDRAGGYTVGYREEQQNYVMFRIRDPRQVFVNVPPPAEVSYGLITVAWDGARRVIAFCGITSDGAAAGVEFLTSLEAVERLWEKLRREGLTDWPASFQVVVRNSSSAGYPVSVEYAAHLVLER
jgi:hypothetical protein